MRTIDMHAHLAPQCFWKATENGGNWHGITREQDARGREFAIIGTERALMIPKTSWTPEQRMMDMDSLGVMSTWSPLTLLSTIIAWTLQLQRRLLKTVTTRFTR